jgi:hypothetical protein
MSRVQEIAGLPFPWGGRKHTGWLPKGAVEPQPTPVEADILDILIEEESGGFLLIWSGRLTGRHGDTWHESLMKAEEQAEANFDIVPAQWVRADIRRAAERSFPSDVQSAMEALSGIRKAHPVQCALLVLADGDRERLRSLLEHVRSDWRHDLSSELDWKRNYEKDAVPPEELARRFEALGLPVPERVAKQAQERRSLGH